MVPLGFLRFQKIIVFGNYLKDCYNETDNFVGCCYVQLANRFQSARDH